MHTPFVQLHFKLAPPADKLQPYGLFAIRLQFHAAFRRATGCFADGPSCRGGNDCPCRHVFDQTLAADPSALRRFQKPPLPFAFKIPVLSEKVRHDHEVDVSLVIAGEAINYLALFIKAVLVLLEPSGLLKKWRIVTVEAAALDGARTVIPVGAIGDEFASLPILSFDELFSGSGSNCPRVTMNFQTPLRLMHKGFPLKDLSFSAVTGALFRRISALAYYYGREELPHDFKWLARRSQEVVCTGSDLAWVHHGSSLQGLEGSAEFSGELADFIPYLLLGSRLNVGKGAAYGMGNFSFLTE